MLFFNVFSLLDVNSSSNINDSNKMGFKSFVIGCHHLKSNVGLAAAYNTKFDWRFQLPIFVM